MLGNPTVTLTHELPNGRLADVMRAPSAAALAGLRDGYYLDPEGKVLGNTCVYARAFRKLIEEGKAPAIAYAHIEAFRGSSALVRGRWWHTVRVAAPLWLLSVAAGPILGFALIFTGLDLVWINLLGSLVFALFIPYVTAGRTLLYFDLQVRAEDVRPRSRAGLAAALAGRRRRRRRALPQS
jgi:hypothetical protein